MFQIITDSCCDLTARQCREHSISVVRLTVTYDETTIFPDGQMEPEDFYAGIRRGKLPQTAAVNPEQWESLMRPALEQGQDVLAITMPAGISGTYQSACIAAEELRERFPAGNIFVVDSTAASLAQGMLVLEAARLRDEGATAEATAQWLEAQKKSFCVWLAAEDLMHLKRGGRLGAAAALVGTMLQIKPLIYLNEEGRLAQGQKVRGRKAAIHALCDRVKTTGLPGENATVAVGHAACEADALALARLLKTECGVQEVTIGTIGNVIGAHVGPGALIVCYRAVRRN